MFKIARDNIGKPESCTDIEVENRGRYNWRLDILETIFLFSLIVFAR